MPVVRRSADPNAPLWLSASSYGFGWMNVTSCSEPRRLQHGGYEPGYFAAVILLPRERLGLVVLAASAPVGFRSYSGLFALLREAGVLGAPASPPPAPELVSAAKRTHFKLRCAKLPETLLDLSVFLDDASGRITGFDLHRDAPDDAVCAP